MVTAAIKLRHLVFGRKAMTSLDSILKSRDITLPTKVHLVKAMVFPVVMYECESWTLKKAEHQRIDAFELWCWRRLFSFFFLFFFIFSFIFISWRLITLQYCSGFCHTLTWISHGFTCISPSQSPLSPPSPSHPSGSSQCTSPEHLSHASNLGWWSVSPLIVYLFQCYCLRASHPCLLPQSPNWSPLYRVK